MSREERGFASIDPAKQREIASKGGRAAHQKGTAHEWTREEAREAGRKRGMMSRGHPVETVNGASPIDEGPICFRRSPAAVGLIRFAWTGCLRGLSQPLALIEHEQRDRP
jgi:general stress protein YciG